VFFFFFFWGIHKQGFPKQDMNEGKKLHKMRLAL